MRQAVPENQGPLRAKAAWFACSAVTFRANPRGCRPTSCERAASMLRNVWRAHSWQSGESLLAAPQARLYAYEARRLAPRGNPMNRRYTFRLLLAGAVATVSFQAAAQRRERPIRLGYLSGGAVDDINLAAFRDGLVRIGWVEGRDFTLKARFADFDYDRLKTLVDEFIREGVNILVATGPASRVVNYAQRAVPVAFTMSGDPVAGGLVASLGRPGGNATGISQLSYELAGKRLQLLREAMPSANRTAVLWSPMHYGEAEERRVTQVAADNLGLELIVRPVLTRAEVLDALSAAEVARCDSITCFPDPVTLTNRRIIAARARELRMPSVFGRREFAEAGGLISYGPIISETYARLAHFVQKIADGAQPGDLPVELPSAIETVVNLGTAAAIGVSLPASLVARTDVVIE